MSEELTLQVTFSYVPETGLFTASLPNGARFSVAPINVSGKLGANLDLLRDFTMREKGGHAPRPHVAAADYGASRDAELVEAAIAAGRITRAQPAPSRRDAKLNISLEELGL